MLIDFKEIPQSNGGAVDQDIFEKFSRDFFECIDYEIISGPGRGADGGIDLKVKDNKSGYEFFWLVSCKHYAHSGKSITKMIEKDILDRVKGNGCNGFIGFYSTIANESLINNLKGLKNEIAYQLFDNEIIEGIIVGDSTKENLFKRYFPDSYKKWCMFYNYTMPIALFEKYLDQNYFADKKFLSKLFISTGYIMKMIKQFDSLETALSANNINYYLIPEFSDGCQPFFEPISIHDFQDVVVTKIIQNSLNINFSLESRGIYGGGREIFYAYYTNHLFFSKEYFEKVSTMYFDLKSLLT